METFETLIGKCKEKMRYGDLWIDFELSELVVYAMIKAKRGKILYERNILDKAEDDLLDAINILMCSIFKMYSLKEKNNK